MRIPKTKYKDGQLVGFQFDESTEVNAVKFLQEIPGYNPFEQAEGYYFDLDEWNKIMSVLTQKAV
jgi:hypothetical protein